MFSAEATPVLLEGRRLTVRQSTRLGPGMHVVPVTPLVLLLLLQQILFAQILIGVAFLLVQG